MSLEAINGNENSMIETPLRDRAKSAAAEGLNRTAQFVREKAAASSDPLRPLVDEGQTVAEKVAAKLESAADFVQKIPLNDIQDRSSDLIRRYPFRALGLGLGLGLLLGKATRR